MRILFLDDEAWRHDAVDKVFDGHVVHHCYDMDSFMETLKEPKFDLISLDHDLGDIVTFDDGYKYERTGQDCARYLAQNLPSDKMPRRVVIHSWNPAGARAMYQILWDAGIRSFLEPFSPNVPIIGA
jgi:hypothetical protein